MNRVGVLSKICMVIVLLALLNTYLFAESSESSDVFKYIIVDGVIDGGYSDLISRHLGDSNITVVIELRTNGGYLKPTQDIVNSIMEYRGEVIIFIPPGGHAFSAGAYIALSSDILAMAVGTAIGSAEPRDLTGGVDPKVVNAMESWIASIADARGRNTTAARLMVTENRDYTAYEAVKVGLADMVVNDRVDLLNRLGLDMNNAVVVDKDVRSQVLSLVSDPMVIGLLLNIAAILILIELIHPTYIGFIAASASIILAFLGMGLIGANSTAIILMLVGIAAILSEIWAGEGELAVSGAVLTVIGVLLLYRGEQFIWTFNYRLFVIGTAILTIAGISFFGFYLHKIKEVLMHKESPLDKRRLIGMKGVVKDLIKPDKPGVVLVESDLWTAVSDEVIYPGEEIEVIGIEGLTLKVRRVSG